MKLILLLSILSSSMIFASDNFYTCEADDLQTEAVENNVTKGYSVAIYYNDNGGSFARVYQGPVNPSGPLLTVANLALVRSQSTLTDTYTKQSTRTPLEFTHISKIGVLNFGNPNGTKSYLCVLK